MPSSPDRVRHGLKLVTDAAKADLRKVGEAAQGESPSEIRAALFAATPLLLDEYGDGAAALALDWYEEIRDAANVASSFTPSPLRLITDDDIAAMVAQATVGLRDIEAQIESEAEKLLEEITRTSLTLLEGGLQEQVANVFRDTVTGNVAVDPDAVGWQRFARPHACKFCLMLAARGAVYTESTVRFSAHAAVVEGKKRGGDCMCTAGPSFDPDAPRASVIQQVGSKRQRSEKERADLRAYLNHNFPDAPG